MKNPDKPKVVDIFSGIGCASLGFKKAGFELAAALEIDPLRCEIYEKNLRLKPLQRDIMRINGKMLLEHAGLRRGGKFCVVGCPPCQSFSKLSDTTGVNVLSDPRSKYVSKFARIIEEMKPAAVVFENVFWMIDGPGQKFFDHYIRKMTKAGYYTDFETINAANFGVPQNRRRVVAISIRKKFLKKKTKKELKKFFKTKMDRPKTVRSAIKDLKPLRPGQVDKNDSLHFARNHDPKVLKLIKNIPKNGGSRRDLPKRLWLNCHKKIKHGADSVYGRMRWNSPSTTMTCRCTTPSCGRFIHPSQNRGISLREAARLQTIPDNFKLAATNRQKAEEMIGDAVPVRLAQRIGAVVLQVLS